MLFDCETTTCQRCGNLFQFSKQYGVDYVYRDEYVGYEYDGHDYCASCKPLTQEVQDNG